MSTPEDKFAPPSAPPSFATADDATKVGPLIVEDEVDPNAPKADQIDAQAPKPAPAADVIPAQKRDLAAQPPASLQQPLQPIQQPPTEPAAPKPAPEKIKKAEHRAEAYADYVKKVENGSELIQRIIDMPNDAGLKSRISFKKLEQVSAEVFEKVIYFFREFEEKKAVATAEALDKLGRDFIKTLKGDLLGFAPAVRSIVYQDVRKKLFPEPEKQTSAAPVPAPAPEKAAATTTPPGAEKLPETDEEISAMLDEYRSKS